MEASSVNTGYTKGMDVCQKIMNPNIKESCCMTTSDDSARSVSMEKATETIN